MISNAPALAFRVLEIPLVPKGTLLGAALSDGLLGREKMFNNKMLA